MNGTLLVIPHFNDTKRLGPFLEEIMVTLPKHFSVLVSDDGSSGAEQEKLTQLIYGFAGRSAAEGPQLLPALFVKENTGKGGAVYRGWHHADNYSLLAFADADGAVSATEILRAESHVRSNEFTADALFGSRIKMLGRSIKRSLLRHLSGRIFATLVSEMGNIPAYDTQCGMKILKQEAYQKIKPDLQCLGFAFDVELALLLLKTGNQIIEFPIDWHDVKGSKINLLSDSLKMTFEVIKLKSRIEKNQKME